MKIGFTGTRKGMNGKQVHNFTKHVALLEIHVGIEEFHHGDCVGADADSHEIIRGLCRSPLCNIEINIWPPVKQDKRANCKPYDRLHPPQSYFARNRSIVDSVDMLLAAPPTNTHMTKGGTWYTIDYAKKKNVQHIIFYPNGEIEECS